MKLSNQGYRHDHPIRVWRDLDSLDWSSWSLNPALRNLNCEASSLFQLCKAIITLNPKPLNPKPDPHESRPWHPAQRKGGADAAERGRMGKLVGCGLGFINYGLRFRCPWV